MRNIFKRIVKWITSWTHFLSYINIAVGQSIKKDQRALKLAEQFALSFTEAKSIIDLTDGIGIADTHIAPLIKQAVQAGVEPFIHISRIISIIHRDLMNAEKIANPMQVIDPKTNKPVLLKCEVCGIEVTNLASMCFQHTPVEDILTDEDLSEILDYVEIFKLERCCCEEEDKEVDDLAKLLQDSIVYFRAEIIRLTNENIKLKEGKENE